MSAFYNEIDPKAAAWLRELIKAGLIAPGIVDERSIKDITAADLDGFDQVHCFAGIGVWSYALRSVGWRDDRPCGTGSCPCQPFSAAGKGAGFDDARHLWPEWIRLILEARERGQRWADTIFGEQVASKDGLGWLDLVHADMEAADYAFGAVDLCAAGVGAPHIRQRLYFVGALADASAERLQRRLPGRSHAEREDINGSAGRGGTAFGLALTDDTLRRPDDATGDDSDRREARRDEGAGHAAAGGRDGGVEHSQGDGRVERGSEPRRRSAVGGRGDGGVADTDGGDAGAEGLQRSRKHGQQQQEDGRSVGGVADTRLHEPQGRNAAAADDDRRRGAGLLEGFEPASCGAAGRPGPTNGFWGNPDWLFCRDGRWRPVEPGTFPLADGAPARVGRLRGYGNAVVGEVAATFIASYMDVVDA